MGPLSPVPGGTERVYHLVVAVRRFCLQGLVVCGTWVLVLLADSRLASCWDAFYMARAEAHPT